MTPSSHRLEAPGYQGRIILSFKDEEFDTTDCEVSAADVLTLLLPHAQGTKDLLMDPLPATQHSPAIIPDKVPLSKEQYLKPGSQHKSEMHLQ